MEHQEKKIAELLPPLSLKKQFRLYWASLRPRESLMMLGVPVLGILFSPQFEITSLSVFQMGIFFISAFCIAGHVYTLNDLCGLSYDIYDIHKLERPIHSKQLQAREVFVFSIMMMIVGLFLDLWLNLTVFLIGVTIILLWVVYALPATLFKGIPIVTSLMNCLGSGMLPFLLGYALFTPQLDNRGFLLSLFFGIIAGAGQMNREIIDIEPDTQAGLITTAVKFGPKRTFVLSYVFFVFSSFYFLFLCVENIIFPLYLSAGPIAGSLLHTLVFLHFYLTKGFMSRSKLIVYVKMYRAFYALVGLFLMGMLLTTP